MLSALTILLSTALAAADAQDPRSEPERLVQRYYSMVLPEDWRALTVDEARQLRAQLPTSLSGVYPHQGQMVYGAVDRWIESGFEGFGLVVHQNQSGEIPLGEEGLQLLREEIPNRPGNPRRIVSLEERAIGEDSHPALVAELASTDTNTRRDLRSLEFYVPTGGQLLILSFTSWEDSFGRAAPVFQQMVSSLTFARQARGPKEVGDQLLYAALIGAVVGVILIVLRKTTRSRA